MKKLYHMTISGWILMISVGFNAAISVRVNNELGAGNHKSAAFSVIIVNIYSLIISVILAIALLAYRDVLSYAFTEGKKVSAAVCELCPLLAIVLNGIQLVLSGVAVGCGWQTFVAKFNVGCYYIIGIPLGVLFGFYFKFDAKGIWTGMICGGRSFQKAGHMEQQETRSGFTNDESGCKFGSL